MTRLIFPIVIALLAVSAGAGEPAIEVQKIAAGLDGPVSIAHAADSRLFLVQLNGTVLIHDGAALLTQPFLDLRPLVSSGGDRGLLDIAFHPRFVENGLFYAAYTDSVRGEIVVSRFHVSASNPNVADQESEEILITEQDPHPIHKSGLLEFGPDGFLYVALGDGGPEGDPYGMGRKGFYLLAKILRIEVDERPGYEIPGTNPYATLLYPRPETWAMGVRNPTGMTFDRATGDFWMTDGGVGGWSEVNVQPASSGGGENYGWNWMEGIDHCVYRPQGCEHEVFARPILEYANAGGRCSVAGGVLYRGSDHPRLRGTYLYADQCTGEIFGATRDIDGKWTSRLLLDAPFTIRAIGEDARGEVYVAGYSTGELFRIEAAAQEPSRRRAVRH